MLTTSPPPFELLRQLTCQSLIKNYLEKGWLVEQIAKEMQLSIEEIEILRQV